MKRAFLISLAVALTCCVTPFTANAAYVSAPEIGDSLATSSIVESVYAERVAYLVNQQRKQNGLEEIQLLPTLNRMANVRSQEISVVFDHVRPDGTGLREIVEEYNFNWRKIGENIAAGQATPESAMDSWMNSQAHRANILNPDYQYIGVSCYYANGMYYWVQIFFRSGSAVEMGAYYPKNCGDVNDNGVIDAVDATMVLTDYARCSVGAASSFDAYHQEVADMTRDGIVNGVDASSILTYYAKTSV